MMSLELVFLITMAVCADFESCIAFSLEKLGRAGVSLKPEQKLAVKAIFEGKDAFLCLPTGYGKSLCYQTLLFVMDFRPCW